MRSRDGSDPARVVVGAVLAVTGVSPVLADVVVPRTAEQHLRNPSWPPHAKFHDGQYVLMGVLIGAIGLRVLLKRQGDPRARLDLAAAVAAVPWLSMWGALLFPGTAANDPEFDHAEPRVLGMHPQLFLAFVMLVGLSAAVATERRRERR